MDVTKYQDIESNSIERLGGVLPHDGNNQLNGNSSPAAGSGVGHQKSTANTRTTSTSGLRRPTPPMSQSTTASVPLIPLTLTIHKDSSGYGMKVSGDKPVYVESVRATGAADKAGLHPGDIICKVNGTEVEHVSHKQVVTLIQSSAIVELTIKRSPRRDPRLIQSTNSGRNMGPGTPVSQQRSSITAPLPVDGEKRRELEFATIKTLKLMLEQEMKNLEKMNADNTNNHAARTRAEATIEKLQEKIRQVGGEESLDNISLKLLSHKTQTPNIVTTVVGPQQQSVSHQTSTPAFLSLFPRSLSSLSIGTRKKSCEKENNVTTPTKSTGTERDPYYPEVELRNLMKMAKPPTSATGLHFKGISDTPPPLPQRNPAMRTSISAGENLKDIALRKTLISSPISDLDHSNHDSSNNNPKNQGSSLPVANKNNSNNRKRSKTKVKAISDPKMSSQTFIESEQQQSHSANSNQPPPLPPRWPGMQEEKQNFVNNNKQSSNNGGRVLPNSLDSVMNYPLISTCTPVRDNLAFPLSKRPNIVKQLQQTSNNNINQQLQTRLSQQHLFHQPKSPINKSSAFSLSGQQMTKNVNSKNHRRAGSSPDHWQSSEAAAHRLSDNHHKKTSSGSWEIVQKDHEDAPIGTPPPPYNSPLAAAQSHADELNHMDPSMFSSTDGAANFSDLNSSKNSSFQSGPIHAASTNTSQMAIISMEDDEISDDEDEMIAEHGPFLTAQKLLETENVLHLAVFLNYVLSNSDPSPLLFYLITTLYKEGSQKDMRKWAYEIHSTFLVPRAPLLWSNVDESVAREVDSVLQNEYDKGEILRKIFYKGRIKAKEVINQQLDDFRVKRTAGLGTMYGPPDAQLMDAKGDKNREQKIFEETLMPKLQKLVDDIEKESPQECAKKVALSSALSTVMHRIFFSSKTSPNSPIDKVHHFVSREKSFKSRLMGKNRKMSTLGHHLVLRQYYEVTHCNHCQSIIWGVSPQGYHCVDCSLNIHRACSRILEEHCPGPAPQKHGDNKVRNLITKFRPYNRRHDEEGTEITCTPDRPTSSGNAVVRQPSDRRPDFNSSGSSNLSHQPGINETITTSLDDTVALLEAERGASSAHKSNAKSKSAPVSVNRSESYKERLTQKRHRNTKRKTSDPSLSKTNDEQPQQQPNSESGIVNNTIYTASSNSSLSSSADSPNISLDTVGTNTTGQSSMPIPQQWVDSDDEADLEVDWSSNVAPDILQSLSEAEKKRQEIINEIYQTERNHVRTLRLLEGIFMRPLQAANVLSTEHLNLLFPPSLLILKNLHTAFEQQMKQRRQDHGSLVKSIGDLLTAIFDGRTGDELREHAAQFCARQQIALEALKEKRKKDENLQRLLSKAESHKACRRLQLKDLLPTALQRLTKYPLLFENLYKVTTRVMPENEIETESIKTAITASKKILDHVNQAVRIAEDNHKLQTIQRKLDKSLFEKEGGTEKLDLTEQKLIHDGPLVMKKNPAVQLHGLLFETMMVLLQKQDDKYILKYHINPGAGTGEKKEERFNPITKIHVTLVRQSAADKNTFFLINTSVSQMLELTAPSNTECKAWFKHISEAADVYKSKNKNEDTSNLTSKNTFETDPNQNTLSSASFSDKQLDDSCVTGHSDDSLVNRFQTKDDEKNNKKFHISDSSDDEDVEQQNARNRITDSSPKNSNSTRTLTQQCSLVAPSEVQISVSPILTAEPVYTPSEQLRRLDDSIRKNLEEKKQIVCDMFRVPTEHFTAITDIAGQPEAPKDPSDLVLAAFAQVQLLTETLNSFMHISTHQHISAVSTPLCDECVTNQQNQLMTLYKRPSPPKGIKHIPSAGELKEITDNHSSIGQQESEDDECIEIDVDRLPAVLRMDSPSLNSTTKSKTNSQSEQLKRQSTIGVDSIPEETEHEIKAEAAIESNTDSRTKNDMKVGSELVSDEVAVGQTPSVVSLIEDQLNSKRPLNEVSHQTTMNGDGLLELCNPNRLMHAASLVPSVPCHLILNYVNNLNQHISSLLPKLNERDLEREKLKKENQHLRELLNSMHSAQRASFEKEASKESRSSEEKDQPGHSQNEQ